MVGQCKVAQFAPALCRSPQKARVSLQYQAVRPGQAATPGCAAWLLQQTLGSEQKKDKEINWPAGYASHLQTGVTLDIAQVTPYKPEYARDVSFRNCYQ